MSSEPEVKQRFTAGQTDATRRYRVKENGAAKDLSTYTAAKLYARKGDGTAVPVITGTIAGGTDGYVDVDHTTIAANEGVYLCELEVTNASAKTNYTEDTFLITVRARAQSVPV